MIALFNKYFLTPTTDECVLKLSLDDFTNHPSVLAIKWIARLRSTFHSTQSVYLVLLYLLQIWTLWNLLAQMDYGQNCPAPVIAGPQKSSSGLKRVNMVNYGEGMKDGKFLSSVKQMWKWNDQDVTSVGGTIKKSDSLTGIEPMTSQTSRGRSIHLSEGELMESETIHLFQ